MYKYFTSKWFLIAVLSIPGIQMMVQALKFPWSENDYATLMHSSGEMAARMLILTLLLSPLRLIFQKSRFLKWLLKNRRYLGVLSFFYALGHLSIYVGYHFNISRILSDLGKWTYLFGWLAFIIFVPLFLTSTDWAVNKMGFKKWKLLQRSVYLATVFAFLHWLVKENEFAIPALLNFLPLAVLEIYRIYAFYTHRSKQTESAA